MDAYRIQVFQPEAALPRDHPRCGEGITLDGWHDVSVINETEMGWCYAVDPRQPTEFHDKGEAREVAQLLTAATGKRAQVVEAPSRLRPWTQSPLDLP